MSEPSQQANGIGGYVAVAVITAIAVLSLKGEDKHPEPIVPISPPTVAPVIPVTVTAPPTNSALPEAAKPKVEHYYASAEGDVYYYGRAISEEERKRGKRAPDMLGFWYLGKDGKGRDLVQDVVAGRGGDISACARPCKIIHYADGATIGFDEGSIIGSAFADAQRGFLKKHSSQSTPPASATRPVATAGPAFDPEAEPMDQD